MTSALVSPSRTLAAQLPSATPGSQVRIEGWVHRRRELGALTFLILRDRSGLAQVVVRDPEARQVVRRCGEETVVAVTGVATPNPAAPDGTEVTEPRITLLGEPAQAPPVDLWRPALDAGVAAARRVRDRTGALDRSAHPGREHPGGHAVPPRPAPPDTVNPGGPGQLDSGSRVDAEASGHLVVPPVFKTGGRRAASSAGSIPVRLRYDVCTMSAATITPPLTV